VSLVLCLCSAGRGRGQDLGTLPLDGVHDATGEAYAFVELSSPRHSYYVGEPIPVRLRLGFDTRFLRENLIQLFRQSLDLPVQVQASWLGELSVPPASAGGEQGGEGERSSLALNGAVVEAPRTLEQRLDGREFTLLEIDRRILAGTPGRLVIPATVLRFAYARQFREDLVQGRMAVDRTDAYVLGNELELTILELPEEGRPPDFGGVVGPVALSASAEPRELELGESLVLRLVFEGEGNLGALEAPRLDTLDGFHVLGKIDEGDAWRRELSYDLRPLGERVQRIPAIAFTHFDTSSPAGYHTLRTRAIPLRVRPTSTQVSEPPPAGAEAQPAPERSATRTTLVVVVVAALLAASVAILRATRRPGRLDPRAERARAAARGFRSRAELAETDPGQALGEFLAECLDCPSAAILSPDLAVRLEVIGVPAELARRTARLLDELVAARYGGARPENGMLDASELVDALESALRERQRAR
jgi:hypothetical protein